MPGSTTNPIGAGLSVTVQCLSTPGNQVSLDNNSGHNVEVFIDDSRGLTTTPHVRALATGASASTDVDTTANAMRRVIIKAGFPVVTVVRETASPAGCYSVIHGLT